MLFRPLVCRVIRSRREKTRNEKRDLGSRGKLRLYPFGHAPAFAESALPRESHLPVRLRQGGTRNRQPGHTVIGHTRLPQLRGNGRENSLRFTSQSSKCQTLRPTYTTLHARYAYTCPLPSPIKSKSDSRECRVASNPTSRGVFVRARRDPCAKYEPRSLVASIIQMYSVNN